MRKINIQAIAASTLAISIAAVATPAFAQSTGSVDFEKTIVVTGTRGPRAVAGVTLPDTPKAKQVLDQAVISRQTPGQTVNDIINLVPGVSFQNADPFGSAGGTLTIRGFDSSRISQTFDGLPLNDTGNYALYSNQQIDPELIEQVNVNLGTTDVDSPTASASGSTVNIRSRKPSEKAGAQVVGSLGEFDFKRIFGVIDSGNLTSSGTRLFVAASDASNRQVYGGVARVHKTQVNAKLYQPIGDNGDFISVAGHYNQNRNGYGGSVPLRLDSSRVVGGATSNRFPLNNAERFYTSASCTVASGVNGVADTASSCGTAYEYNYNPSNTGNIRLNSRFTLAKGLVLTVDPSFQFVSANGGGARYTAYEGYASSTTTRIGSASNVMSFGGVDLNGDGDKLDAVTVMAPSQTKTRRYGVNASLRYEINADQMIRVAYAYDMGRHRQTAEVGRLAANGYGLTYFPSESAILAADGTVMNRRNRLSYAILQQVAAEYRGDFFDRKVTVNIGLRAPFFRRNLNNYCFTTSSGGAVSCFGTAAANASFAAANPTAASPQTRIFNYSRVLPTFGITGKLNSHVQSFFNYSKGLSVPGTDNLYNSFYYAAGNAAAKPDPETTDNFDAGLRYRSPTITAQASAWYTIFTNRLASSYDQELGVSIYRNLGRVDKYGIDGSVAWTPVEKLSLYAFGSYLWSEIKNNVQTGATTFAATAGKREAGAPVYTLGARAQGELGPVSLGLQVKRTGKRYVNDMNLPVLSGTTQVYGSVAPGYTLVDFDMKLPLKKLGEKAYFQFNVTNLFDKLYVAGFSGQGTSQTSVPNAYIGSPRTAIGTLSIGF